MKNTTLPCDRSRAARARLLLTTLLSIAVHAAAIGVAALWPHQLPASPTPLEVGILDDPVEPGANPFESGEVSEVPSPPLEEPATPNPETPVPEMEVELPPLPAADDPFVDPAPLEKTVRRPSANDPTPARPTNAIRPTRSGPTGAGNPGASTGPGTPGGLAGHGGGWITSKPTYPYAALRKHLSGSGRVRIRTDASGRVVSAEIVNSIGPEFDGSTLAFIRSRWFGPPDQTAVVPVAYQPRWPTTAKARRAQPTGLSQSRVLEAEPRRGALPTGRKESRSQGQVAGASMGEPVGSAPMRVAEIRSSSASSSGFRNGLER